ncbi:hypothetical protein NQ314_016454 [Rhamnusium bicolor]|uniref:X-box-binding protein 1 n=1 Tax=Rhamnusium bicolor TaxID=1586634 RepID=A0AAV8WX93_9CUCU|nr:hypothetical protein NQ314_016454 [Rhamnusium bicolor]
MSATVPAILKYLNSQDFSMDQDNDMPQRAKKRRLDHLSWEEKIQRKKLKNRVAAQTSRDRKKAKMEQMEHALQQLFSQNEALMAECEKLKVSNERLTEEKTELYNRLQMPCANCCQNRTVECEAQNGSTESLLLPQGKATHSAAALNNQLAVMLWKIILTCLLYRTCSMNSTQKSTLTLWSNSHRAFFKISPETWKQLLRKQIAKKLLPKESVSNRQDNSEEMVGPPSTKLESHGCEMLTDDKKSLENDISEYLLLHHNYAAKPPKCTKKSKSPLTKSKLKAIKPKKNTNILNTSKLAIDNDTPVILTENSVVNGKIYGSYDENMNCVTIIIDENGIPIDEAVTEVVTTEGSETIAAEDHVPDNTMLTVPSQIWGNASPMSTSSSDHGYESLDSPNSLLEMDIWDQSVSELFPSLF